MATSSSSFTALASQSMDQGQDYWDERFIEFSLIISGIIKEIIAIARTNSKKRLLDACGIFGRQTINDFISDFTRFIGDKDRVIEFLQIVDSLNNIISNDDDLEKRENLIFSGGFATDTVTLFLANFMVFSSSPSPINDAKNKNSSGDSSDKKFWEFVQWWLTNNWRMRNGLLRKDVFFRHAIFFKARAITNLCKSLTTHSS